MDNKLILIRGLPGSGKSTLAKNYVDNKIKPLIHLETDMYFLDKQGVYRFEAKQLSNAHRWCQSKTKEALLLGSSVVVSNTFVQRWEMKPYIQMAKHLEVTLDVVVCRKNYGSIHNIPLETINRMRKKWQE